MRCKLPEGPEMLISADLVRPIIQHHIITNVIPTKTGRYKDTYPQGYHDFVNGLKDECRVIDIQTRGKFMYWTFSNQKYMFLTFGMTGQLSPIKGKHPCFIFEHSFDGKKEELFFNDHRHFGTIRFTDNKNDLINKLNDLGWDPLQMSLEKNIDWLNSIILKSNKPISQLLMDQSIFAGVGNYIKSESLYAAKISPWKLGSSFAKEQLKILCQCIVEVMSESYKQQGATLNTYKNAFNEPGQYSNFFKVYGKQKDPLGNVIITETTPDKRTTHWCPSIQL